jgi:imidazolonepropionase
MTRAEVVVVGAAQVATVRTPEDPGVVESGAVAIAGDRVLGVCPQGELGERFGVDARTRRIDARGGVVLPGLVDPHTHLLFGGSRHEEFAVRLAGADYLEILAAGGGIHSTVAATRAATDDDLLRRARAYLAQMLSFGVTTVEVKSGYGLSAPHELRLLRLAKVLASDRAARIVPTLLGAHAVPREHASSRDRYVASVIEEMIPAAAREGLAVACDVFLEEGAFAPDEARAILRAAKAAGLAVKVHAGQFTDQGGAELAADLGAVSADHLEHVSDAGLAAMAKAGVCAVLLPGPGLSIRGAWADGRRMREAGVTVALATDCNPGTSHTTNLPLMALGAANHMGLTPTECLYAVTRGAALALGRPDLGHLEPGARADVAILDLPDWRGLLHRFGAPLAKRAIVGGEVVLG